MFKIILGYRNWYQSKVKNCDFLITFQYNYVPNFIVSETGDLLFEILLLFAVLPTQVLFEALTRGFPWDLGYKNWCRQTRATSATLS